MTIGLLLEKLGTAGIRLRNSGGELRVAGNRAALDAELIGQLRIHKSALLELVGPEGEEWWTPAAPETNGHAPAAACIHELFAAQAARTPDATAITWRGERLTYAELDARANRLAHALRRRGVGPEVRVGVCLPRAPQMVVALLGVLKAGGAYVPLDPVYPRERLGYMVEDAEIALVLTESHLVERLPGAAAATLLLDREADALAAEPTDAPATGIIPENLSHVIFTSGSTGRPKGVMIRHSSTALLVHWMREIVSDEERAAALFSTSINFDVSVAELFGMLCWGATLVLVENALELATVKEPVVYASMVPTAAAELLRAGAIPATVRTMNLGGEALPLALAQGLYGTGTVEKVGNLYGPTEDTTYSTYSLVAKDADRVLVGRPVAGARAFVLDDRLQPVPLGVVGELYLSGDGLSRGYANRPGLTAERFLPCPFGPPGARMYRVMDRVLWRENGELEYLGRTDFQVKVRGHRIELGEIETRLREHTAVRDAVVLAREDAPGDVRLVAYFVGAPADSAEPIDGAAGAESLRAHLSACLPAYMVPAAYVRLDRLPLTPNGKLDRGALPAPHDDAFVTRGYEAPLGETESALAGIWSEVLGIEQPGRHDQFFELGGHSLLAVQVISRVRQELGVEVELGDLFATPVLSDFARGLEKATRAELPAIEPAPRDGRIPLSFAQQRLWFVEQLGGLGSTYHIPTRMRLRGALDRPALVRALDAIVARHESLRTTFAQADGIPEQRIASAESSRFHLLEHDLACHSDARAELGRLMAEEADSPFDLERGPLIRGRLVRLGDEDHLLLITMHHIVSDGWSMGVLTRELGELYAAHREGRDAHLPDLPVQYADYAAWQRRWVDGDVLQAQADYWTRTLSGAPELLELPTDRPRPPQMDHTGALLRVVFDAELAAGLKTVSRRHGTTLYMTLLAAWATVLSRLSGQDDVVIGTPTANRGRREIEGLIGFFVNTLAVRVDLSGDPGVAALLDRVKERSLGAQQNQDIPFEQVVDLVDPARSLAHAPLFQVMFALQNTPGEGGVSLAGLQVGGVGGGVGGGGSTGSAAAQVQAKFDLSLSLHEAGDRIAGDLTYATALFDRETVERYVDYLRRVLGEMVADDARRVSRLTLMAEAERAQVVETWNATEADYARDACIHELFEAQVARTPEAAALVFGGETLTFAALNERANRLAHHLRERGVGPDTRVALCLERGIDAIVGLLTALKAGGAYVPLDPSYPAERLREMLADSRPIVLLTQSSLVDRLRSVGVPVLALDADASTWEDRPQTNLPRAGLTPEHLAYVIYTSGSTGRPKGVMVRHGSVANLVSALQSAIYAHRPGPLRVGVNAPLVFDGSVKQVVQLLAGHALCPVPEDVRRDPAALVAWVRRERVDALDITPSLLRLALAEGLGRDGGFPCFVLVGGEAVDEDLRERMGRVSTRFYNVYGPTECTVDTTVHEIGEDRPAAAIGGPLPNVTTYVLDAALLPVPIGVAGKLYVGGAGLARGYLDRPALTADRFVPDAFGGGAGARLYRTGDRVRWLADGTLEYLGRLDVQVKIRGFRIELGEIESRLIEHAAVREAAVLAREDAPGDKRLVAYIVSDDAVGADVLRAYLAERLPEYMVPAAYVRLDALPLTPNGKLDRKALPAPEGDAYGARAYEPPAGETETALAEIWSELLGVEHVGRHDSFFDLGGHSLLAVQVISRVRQVLGAEVALGDIFVRPVLKDFARELESAARSELPPIERAPRDGHLPLSFAQQRLWFLEQLGDLGGTYHIPARMRLRGALDRGALVRALDRIVARHETLRTTFAETDGVPEQHIAPAEASAFHLAEHDLRGSAEPAAALRRLLRDETVAPFDLQHGPLIRGRLIRIGDEDHILLLTMHHIVSDGWSMGVLTRELGALYEAVCEGREAILPELPVQYADYAVWQRNWVEGDVLREQSDYWTRTLAGAPELIELPADHPRPVKMDHAGADLGVMLDEEVTARLKALSRRNGTTLFMTILAGWAAVLGRLSSQDDVVIGTPTAGRGRREIEDLIGFFVNTLALRVDLSDAPTVAELLARVKAQALGAQQHQDIPFEQVVDLIDPARSLSHTPLFQVMFAWQNAPERELELSGLELAAPGSGPRPSPTARSEAASPSTAKFDLALTLSELGGRIAGSLTYATALFEQATAERFAGYLQRLLAAMAADEHQPVDGLDLLSADERRLVLEDCNATARPYPAVASVYDLFRAQADRTPQSIALSWSGQTLTYAELAAKANRLANTLRRCGVGPEVRVGICLPRTLEMVVALMGVLAAGGAYVPLDPAYPRERLRYMVDDGEITLVITDSDFADRLPADAAKLLLIDREADAIAAESAEAPESGITPENLSHVIFTSGSTGRPKGVMIRQSSVIALLFWLREIVTDEERASLLFSTSINFDVSVAEFLGTLCWGGKLVLVENALELATVSEPVVYASMVPSAAAELLNSGGIPASVKTLNLAGEALPSALAQGLYALGTMEKVGNVYGPTEDTTYSTYSLVARGLDQVLIGTPAANSQAYVLDAHLQPVPIGVAGELYLAGEGLSRGYANRPAMTAERFLPCPFGAPGGRMYRVMDRVRRHVDGQLEYLGRTDFQVKVRGYRIELGEIEARLAEHPRVRVPIILVREDVPGDRRLVAYYLASEPVSVEELKAHLADRIPGYMLPAAYVWMESYPQTPNGKVDRKALPAPEGHAYAGQAYEPPVGETERSLAGIWAEVVGVERVGRHDNFFSLGGHSLLAVRVISRVRQMLGVEVALGDLFARPVLADFARGLETASHADLPPIVPEIRGADVPLSFAQQRLWFIDQLEGAGPAYHIPMRLRLRELDAAALWRALDRIVARHESLRTTFVERDGVPAQRIAPAETSTFHLVEHDLRGHEVAGAELRRLVAEEEGARFDLAHGPLIRGRLIRIGDDDHVLLITMHHIVSDGWSMGVFSRELGALYAAFRDGRPDPLPPLPVQYADYAVWQRKWVDGEVLRAQADYWKGTLSGAPELLELPTDRARPARQDFTGEAIPIELGEDLSARLRALGGRHGATPFITLLAGWAAVLGRLSGQDDVVVGTPTANRGRHEIEDLIGFFVNTLAVRVDLSGTPTVAELLGRVRERALGAQHHQDIPFEQVVDLVDPVRSLSHTPLFQAMFVWENASERDPDLPGLTSPAPRQALSARADAAIDATAKFNLTLALSEQDGRIAGSLTYATALFDRATMVRVSGYLLRTLEAMASDEHQTVVRLPLLPDSERRLVVDEWNQTDADFPCKSAVHGLFEAQAERTPDATAIVFNGEEITYADLNARANRLAHHLRSLGVGIDTRVALAMPRSPALVEAELAILKCGGVYVPLDPEYPAERLRWMLEDSAPAALLTTRDLADRFADLSICVIAVDGELSTWDSLPATNPAIDGVTVHHVAYVMYTSGSTGWPKGVMVPHRAIARLVINNGYADFGPSDRIAFAANPAFDASTMEVWAPLLNGGAIVIIPQDTLLDPARFGEALRTNGVTVLWLTVGLFNQYAEALRDEWARLRYLIIGGDALDPRVIAKVLRDGAPAHLLNGYGPTETTTFAITHEIERVDDGARSIPLGRPISNTRIYLLDGAMEPVPVGVAGEVHIGGDGLARGYLGRPDLTAERFIPDPFGAGPGARLYRTGDLARWLPDGTVEFLGRADTQVKVRGFRIELGEIEARLLEHATVREAVVLAREDAPGDKRLVAYVVGDDAIGAEALRAHLAERLPAYMVPAAYVWLDHLPLTPNGKIDRRALPAPDGDAYSARAYEAPRGATEQALADIWSEVLRIERVGRNDNFFDLGGHSLLAVQVISRVRQALEVEVALGDLFTRPVLADFARELETATHAELPSIQPVAREGRVPLSFAQQRLWFLEQMGGLGSAYHITGRQRLRGHLDHDALIRALDRIVARHEALRTTFAEVDGVPEQRIAPAAESRFHLVEHDLRGVAEAGAELRRLMADEAVAPFDLGRGPLIRGRLIRIGDEDHILLYTMHHIVSDGWSMGVLTHELSVLYSAFREGAPDPLPPLPVQYADYAAWQRRWVGGENLRLQADYWRETLSGAPDRLELPADHARPAVQDHAGALAALELSEELTAGLKALAGRYGSTLYMTLLAGWATTLSRLSSQDDVVIGTPTANRGRREIEGLIGFFVNTLAVRVDLSGDPTPAELLERVKERALGAQQNQDIPFEQVVDLVQPVRSLAHTPLFQVMFAWQNAPERELELPGLALAPAAASRSASPNQPEAVTRTTALFDLSLTLLERGGRIVGSLEYATALFERETIERHIAYLRRVLEEMVADERRRISRIPLLSADERRVLVENWGRAGVIDAADGGVHEWFEAHARRAPSAVAVVDDGREMSYGELNARANRLARHLVSLGVGTDARVVVCGGRSLDLIAALLAVLKAGAAYVPIDPAHPEERLRYVLDDCAPVAVLAQTALAARFADASIPVVRIDDDTEWAAESGDDLAAATSPTQAAYVIYTSGSTGKPKGVVVEHRSVRQQVAALQTELGLSADDRFLQFASFTFDASIEEIFGALCSGAALVLRSDAWLEGAEAFWALCSRHGITVADLPTRFWQILAADEAHIPSHVRAIVIGGEAVDAASVDAWARRAGHRPRLVNGYGPTETTVNATVREVSDDPAAWRSIGRPIAGTRAYLTDARGELVPIGAVGEILIGGGQVARGYLGRPALTAERFIPDPYGGEFGARLYRTGDLGRWRNDGEIEFAGRADFQVKVRGFRIELGEIEARLAEHRGVRDAVVLARDDAPGERRLVAYLTGETIPADALRAHLAERLPEYMVPSAYVWLERLPLTSGGKLDRRALPAPGADAFAAREFAAPLGETEETLAGIWAEVLGLERVGRRDSFFALGGHSLLAVQVISRVRQALGVHAAIGDLFARPVLADFARGLEAASRTELPAIVPVQRGGDLPLSFAQQRLWFIDRLEGAGAAYHIPTRMRLRGELDRDALRRALDRIVARHEALRTTFVEVGGEPVQRISPVESSNFHLIEHDLRGVVDGRNELRRLMMEEAVARFDLSRGPLIRGRLIRIGDDDVVLLITMHHIVSDGWSMGVFTRELSALYAAFREGRPDPLAPLAVQYADYAAWQRTWVDGDVLREQADYWTRTLAGAPELMELPVDRARPARQDFTGGIVGVDLDEALAAGLKALAQRHGATLFMTLLAGWGAMLARLSGQDDVVIGTPTANRGQGEIEGLIGFFVNTLALRLDLSGSPSVAEVLARAKERALGAQHHQDIPFEQVVDLLQPARSLSHTPLFQVLFAWQNAPERELELSGLALAPVGSAPQPSPSADRAAPQTTAKFDLSLALGERAGRISGSVEYAAALFDRATVERFVGYFRRALEAMVADERQSIDQLPLLPKVERRLVVEDWNATDRTYPTDDSVYALFHAQAARTPGAIALSWRGQALTYSDLAAKANRLANMLRRRGIGPEVRVGICLPRTPEMVAALLGVLAAGGAYVPLDPAYPRERLRYMVDDADISLVITDSSLADRLPADAATLMIDREADAIGAESAEAPESGITPENLSHVIFTSGSTGRPKGVMIRQSSVITLLHWLREIVSDEERASVLFSTSINFDVSVAEFLGTLCWGGKLVLVENALELATVDEPVGYASMVPSAAAELLNSGGIPASVKTLNLGGEALPSALAQGLYALGTVEKVGNVYGPTEDTTYSTYSLVERGADHVLIGTPMVNTQAYVLDAHLQPVPIGVVGELYLAGEGLSRGYAKHPAMTAERFVPCPFGAPGGRMYRVMDRARRHADGQLEYLGRTDFQVKVRGYRIELGEIEARLAEHGGVRSPAVLVREDVPGDRRLVAYYLADAPVPVDALKAHLTERLPAYMLPAAYVWMEAYPLTPNGKVDRKALPAPEGDAFAGQAYEPPVGPTERALAGVWAEVLSVDRVGRNDNFFSLGGHSLLAVRVVSRLREALGVEVALGDLFLRPVLADFAREIDGGTVDHTSLDDAAIPVRSAGSAPPLFLTYEGTGSIAYAQVLHPHIAGDVPVYALPAPSASEAALRTVEGMAARLLRMIREVQPAGPYRIAGWSFGGVLAYEIASQLIGRDETVEFVGLIDSYFPSGGGAYDAAQEHALLLDVLRMSSAADSGRLDGAAGDIDAGDADLETFVARCREKGLLPAHVTVSQARQMRDRLRDHQRALREYAPQPIPLDIHLFPAAQGGDEDPARGWQALLPAKQLRVTPVPGTHRSMMRAPNAAVLGDALSRGLGEARREGNSVAESDPSPIMKLHGGKPGVAPLFCVPGAGTSVASFINLLGAVDPSWPVYGLQPRGLDGHTVPHATVEAAAEHYLRAIDDVWPQGPIHLLGHSFGGWVALEMALRLRAAGRPIGSLTILDSEIPGESGGRGESDDRDAFLKLVEVLELTAERSFGIRPAEIDARDQAGRLKLLHQKMIQHGLLNARSTHEVLYGPFRTFSRCLRTVYRPSGIYPDRLRLILVHDPSKDETANLVDIAGIVEGWRRWAPALEFTPGAGNHMTALKPPHVARLAAFLAADRG